MSVLGIFMSRSDSPGAVVSYSTSKFDSNVSDFAWHLSAVSTQGRSYIFTHEPAVGNVTWYHFAQIADGQLASDDGWLHFIRDANGNTIVAFDLIDGLTRITLYGSGSVTTGTMVTPTSLTRFDVELDYTTGISMKLYVEGGTTPLLVANLGSAGTRGKPTTFIVENYDADDVYVSELYVAEFDTRNTRPVKQQPNAVGNYSEWNGGYSELGDENIGTAADGAAAGDKVSVNLEAYPGPASPAGINRVVLKVIGSKGATGPSDIAPFVRIAGVDYTAGDLGVTETPLPYYAEFAENPNTTAPWTTADLDTTEAGLEAKA